MLIKMIENDASTFMELVNGSATDYFDNIKLRSKKSLKISSFPFSIPYVVYEAQEIESKSTIYGI